MLLVILGAGASYDSTPERRVATYPTDEYPYRPPLADQLFDRPVFRKTLSEFNHARALISRFAPLPKGMTVEQVMDQLQTEAEKHPIRQSQLAALRLYLRQIVGMCSDTWLAQSDHFTNYYTLLDQLTTWRDEANQPVCIVTFNYDLMLEDALSTYGLTIESIDSYVNNPDLHVIKPHGSVNWARLVNTPIDPPSVENMIRAAASGLQISDNYILASRYGTQDTNGRMHYPAIALPIESYKEFECPANHLKRLEQCLRDTRAIVIIGWRATEKPFLRLMADKIPQRERPMKVVMVDVSTKNDALENMKASGVAINAEVDYFDVGFSNFITQNNISVLLA
jgi:hypothetical protein